MSTAVTPAISEHLRLRPPETEFERGVRRFSYFLMEVTLVLVLAIFAVNVFFRDHSQHPVLQAFMFSLALAVSLDPDPSCDIMSSSCGAVGRV